MLCTSMQWIRTELFEVIFSIIDSLKFCESHKLGLGIRGHGESDDFGNKKVFLLDLLSIFQKWRSASITVFFFFF